MLNFLNLKSKAKGITTHERPWWRHSCTVFSVFFSAASSKKTHRKQCSWSFLFCQGFRFLFGGVASSLSILWALPAASAGFKEKAFWVNKQKVCESGTTFFRLTAPLNTTILDVKHTVDLSEYHELGKIIEIIYIPWFIYNFKQCRIGKALILFQSIRRKIF